MNLKGVGLTISCNWWGQKNPPAWGPMHTDQACTIHFFFHPKKKQKANTGVYTRKLFTKFTTIIATTDRPRQITCFPNCQKHRFHRYQTLP